MKKSKSQTKLRLLYLIITILAYGYLAYKLVHYDNYSQLSYRLQSATPWQYAALAAAILLFPVNILAEAVKWRYLVRRIYPMSFAEAVKQVFAGTTGAFITPARVGEYPTRVMLFDRDRVERGTELSAVTLGFVGSFALTSLQVIVGIPAALSMLSVSKALWLIIALLLTTYVLLPYICRFINDKLPQQDNSNVKTQLRQALNSLAQLSAKEQIMVLLLSSMRYVIYCLQLALLLYFCSVSLPVTTLAIAIAAYYLLVSITPSIPVADAGIRGSWAIVAFAPLTENTIGAAIAAVILWAINAILPMIIGTLIGNHK